MALEDIKSPLPPRRFSGLYETETEDESQKYESLKVESGEEKKEEPVVPLNAPLISGKIEKKVDHKSYLVYAGIGVAVVAILGLVFGVIIPKVMGGSKVEEVNLTYWGLWEDSSIMGGIIAEYEAANPGVKINYITNQKVNYRTRLQSRLEQGGDTSAPDIFRLHSSWLPMMQDNLAKVPSDVATGIGLDTDYFDVYKRSIKDGANYLGIPLMYDGLALFYNKDLIESGGVTLPKSWWDLEVAANKLTVKDSAGQITVAGVALGLTDNVDHWSDVVGLMLKQGGVKILDPGEDSTKKMKDVLTYYTLFRTKHEVWDETLPNSTEMFANGKLAFYFAPSWRAFNIEDMKVPELRYGIATVPQLPTLNDVPVDQINNEANLTNIHWSTYWLEGVNKKSSKQKEAWKFLTYLSKKESLEKVFATASQVRSFGEIYPRKSMSAKMSENPNLAPFIKVANEADGWYLSSRTFDEGLNDEMIKYFADAINGMVLQSRTPEEVMPNLRNGINQLMQKYQLK
jgi:multiple sugar transport system substrate-binding protein